MREMMECWNRNTEEKLQEISVIKKTKLTSPRSDLMAFLRKLPRLCPRLFIHKLSSSTCNYSNQGNLHVVSQFIKIGFICVQKHALSLLTRWLHWWEASLWREPSILQVEGRSMSSWTIYSLLEGESTPTLQVPSYHFTQLASPNKKLPKSC